MSGGGWSRRRRQGTLLAVAAEQGAPLECLATHATLEALAVEVLAVDVVVEILLTLEALQAEFAREVGRPAVARVGERLRPGGATAEWRHPAANCRLLRSDGSRLLHLDTGMG